MSWEGEGGSGIGEVVPAGGIGGISFVLVGVGIGRGGAGGAAHAGGGPNERAQTRQARR